MSATIAAENSQRLRAYEFAANGRTDERRYICHCHPQRRNNPMPGTNVAVELDKLARSPSRATPAHLEYRCVDQLPESLRAKSSPNGRPEPEQDDGLARRDRKVVLRFPAQRWAICCLRRTYARWIRILGSVYHDVRAPITSIWLIVAANSRLPQRCAGNEGTTFRLVRARPSSALFRLAHWRRSGAQLSAMIQTTRDTRRWAGVHATGTREFVQLDGDIFPAGIISERADGSEQIIGVRRAPFAAKPSARRRLRICSSRLWRKIRCRQMPLSPGG